VPRLWNESRFETICGSPGRRTTKRAIAFIKYRAGLILLLTMSEHANGAIIVGSFRQLRLKLFSQYRIIFFFIVTSRTQQ
jgi:hypothetical protein